MGLLALKGECNTQPIINTTQKEKKESLDNLFVIIQNLGDSNSTLGEKMAAPKGNQNAKGNPKVTGRPMEYDLQKEADALLKWAKKPDSMHLAAFAMERGFAATKLYLWRDKDVDFREALTIAKDQLAIRLREGVNAKTYNERLGARDITAHDSLLKIDERDDMVFASKLKQKEASESFDFEEARIFLRSAERVGAENEKLRKEIDELKKKLGP